MRIYKLVATISALMACVSITFSVAPVAAINGGASLPALEVNIPPEIPLRIVNFHFDPCPRGMVAFHYDVQNASSQGLVAVEVRWQTYSGESPSTEIANRDDRWTTGPLAANRSARFQVSNVASPANQPVTRLVGTIAYAELEDGNGLGTDAARVGRQIAQGRKRTLATYGKLLEAFNAGGSEALTPALKQQSAAPGLDAATQAATAHLLGLLADQGVDAVVLELERVTTLSLPEPEN